MPIADEKLTQTARAVSTPRVCPGCGAPLTGGRPQRQYCDGRCRARASRERRAREVQVTIARLGRLAGVATDPERAGETPAASREFIRVVMRLWGRWWGSDRPPSPRR